MVNSHRIEFFVALIAISTTWVDAPNAANLIADKPKMDSATMELDVPNNTFIVTSVRITTQSGYVIKAGQARTADANNFNNSRWTFANKVEITTPDGSSHADSATVSFVNNQISTLHLEGRPATFEQHSSEKTIAEGNAESIDYDLAQHTVKLSSNVWISYGQTECKAAALIYNIVLQKALFNSEDQQNTRVHCTLAPGNPINPK